MEVDGDGRGLLAPAGTQNSVSLAVHPLLLMNISEHWTRARAQNSGTPAQVVGAVLGHQKGREVEMTNSFEVPFTPEADAGLPALDKAYARSREAQYKEVFPDQDLLGWYTTGEGVNPSDLHLQRQFADLMESPPVLVKLNPAGGRNTDSLPLTAYESLMDVRGDNAGAGSSDQLQFLQLPYTLATEEAERIGVDHVARVSAATRPVSSATKTLLNQYGAVRMLGDRLRLILDWLQAVQAGDLPMDHAIMREVAALTHRLPVLASAEFNAEFAAQANDITLLTCLGTLTKTYGTLNQLVSKLNVMHDRSAGGAFRRAGRHIPL